MKYLGKYIEQKYIDFKFLLLEKTNEEVKKRIYYYIGERSVEEKHRLFLAKVCGL